MTQAAQSLEEPYRHVVSKEPIREVSRLLAAVPAPGRGTSVWSPAPASGAARSVLELEGLGEEVWRGVDAKRYVEELRDEWSAR